MGENGIGKSTLIKILLNILPPDQGGVEWGYGTHVSYFSQDHHDLLNKHASVLAWLDHYAAGSNEQFIRKILAQVLFNKEDVHKDILGLKRRRSRTSLISKNGYRIRECLLILDEPTNHLDIEATAALATALHHYPGTLIVVSHDRHFTSKIANRILFISHQKNCRK